MQQRRSSSALVRDNASLTRPAFIEADLRRIFEGEAFADFAALWLLIHASRFGAPARRADRLRPGTVARGRRQRRVSPRASACATALRRRCSASAAGSSATPTMPRCASGLRAGQLPLSEYFGQLLRLVYRLIFLLAAEDRNCLHPPAAPAGRASSTRRAIPSAALRDHAVRRAAWDRHRDRWEGLLIVVRGARAWRAAPRPAGPRRAVRAGDDRPTWTPPTSPTAI